MGNWWASSIFKNDGRKLTELTTNLKNFSGDYNCVAAADLDNDGDNDIIIGNRGDNSFYKAEATHEVKMFVNDFDNNGKIEQIFTRKIGGKDVPVHLLKELKSQIYTTKIKNISFTDYASKSIDALFPKSILDKSSVKNINTFQSLVLLNNNTQFTAKPLPFRAQISTINNILVRDLNKDGYLDLITTGNNFNYKTQYTRQDASYGDVYFGDGKGNFTWQPPQKTGFFVKGQIRSMQMINNTQKEKLLLVAPNNNFPKLFKLND